MFGKNTHEKSTRASYLKALYFWYFEENIGEGRQSPSFDLFLSSHCVARL